MTTNGISGSSSPLVNPSTAQDKILYMYERQLILDVCNMYAYTLDSTMVDLKVAEDWANLFTEDCQATYPFGTHYGREGLAKFGMTAESRFKRMLVRDNTIAPSARSSLKTDADFDAM